MIYCDLLALRFASTPFKDMLSLLRHGKSHSPFQLAPLEVKQYTSFQLRNLRVQPQEGRPSLQGAQCIQDHTDGKDLRQPTASASTLAFDPNSGDGVLKSICRQAEADTEDGSGTSGLSFDPSSVSDSKSSGGVLKSVSGQAVPAVEDESCSGSGTVSLSFDPSRGDSPVEAELGPSTTRSSSAFTPRSEDTHLLSKMLRSDLAAEMAAVGLFTGRRFVAAGNRPDLDYFKDQENGHLRQLQSLMPAYRARPSLLGPVAAAAGFSLGAAAGLLPTKLSHAITGAAQEALVEQYNDQLRELREAGLSETAEEVRDALRALRDEERAPESSVKVPDIMSLQRPQELTVEEGVAAVVKFGLGNLFSLAAKV